MYPIDDPENFNEELLETLENEQNYSEGERNRLDEIYGIDAPGNDAKREHAIIWDRYKQFSPEFLTKYYDFVLCDIFHHIKALLLFPPNCSCKRNCRCLQLREKVALTLNVRQYTDAQKVEPFHRLKAMKSICYIPEDHVFRELHADAFPLWAIQKEWKAREKKGHFEAIDRLVWTFLRLGQTSKACFAVPGASLNAAISIIVGDTPLKTKAHNAKGAKPLHGEKSYDKLYKHYKPLLHFIAALEYCKKEIPKWDFLFVNTIYSPLAFAEKFLTVAHWFRKNLLLLEKPNVPNKVFLKEEDLYPLPVWVQSEEINLTIEPFQEKVKKILSNALHIDPATKTTTKVDLYAEYCKASSPGVEELEQGPSDKMGDDSLLAT